MRYMHEYSATLQADVICRGYVGILLSARVHTVNQGGTADSDIISTLFVLDRKYISVRDFFYALMKAEEHIMQSLLTESQ